MQRKYDDAITAFRTDEIAGYFSGNVESAINACVECCDRYADSNRIALHWEAADGHSERISFAELRDRSARFANVLRDFGIKPGDRVAGLLPRTPDLMTVVLGTWRAGAIYSPMFTAFGSKAIEHRLNASEARLLVTDEANRGKLEEVTNTTPVATVGGAARIGDLDVAQGMAAASPQFEPVMLRGDDPFLMMFTSGTTGPPKRLLVPLRALMGFIVYMRDSVGLRPDDVFWNMADPGWAYGLYYGVTAPLLLGQATILCEAPFTVEGFYEKIRRLGVTNLIGAPTGYRMIKAAGPELAAQLANRLRVVSSAGEPLNPEVGRWFEEHLQVVVADHYGQTEGGMMICNHHALTHEFRPGSAGRQMPGFRMVILDEEDREVPPGTHGVVAVDRARSPLFWFNGYLGADPPGRYHRTGDMAFTTEDGYCSFVGRADDVITSAGYRIGPYDVESTLIEHPAVREAAVIGKADAERTEIIKAFVVVDPKRLDDPELKAELAQFVRHRLSAHAYPREIEFVSDLPKTSSGKIQRFMLRQRESR